MCFLWSHCKCVWFPYLSTNYIIVHVKVYSQLLPAYINPFVFFGRSVATCWPICSECTGSWWPLTSGRWLSAQSRSPSAWCPWTCSLAMIRSVAGTLTALKPKRWENETIENMSVICSNVLTTWFKVGQPRFKELQDSPPSLLKLIYIYLSIYLDIYLSI